MSQYIAGARSVWHLQQTGYPLRVINGNGHYSC